MVCANRMCAAGLLLVLGGCGSDDGRATGTGVSSLGLSGTDDGGTTTDGPETTSGGIDPDSDTGTDPDGGSLDDESGEPPPSTLDCNYPSTSFGAGMQELDVPTGSSQVLSFTVTGLPDPALISQATLRFDSHDADHPGEEGVIFVNGQGPYDLPADAGWDNMDASGSIDVTGTLVEGINVVEFGAGSLEPRSFYRIGNVAIEAVAQVDECEPAPEPPPKDAVPREVDFYDATYEMRHNWVLRCDGFEYAFTAYGDEHIGSDCDGLYAPDGSRLGTATFSFPAVVPATYEIQIHSRHTVNRNPSGALFVVNGEGIRIDQRDDADFTTDIWGVRDLGGDVTVVLDSSQEGQSDSVIWVRLQPVGG